MSHRWDCPTDYEARREGRRAFDYGYGEWRNPYRSEYGEEGCPEAEKEWKRGFRQAEYEQQEHERQEAERRHIEAMQREEERQQRIAEAEEIEMQSAYDQEMREQYEREMAAQEQASTTETADET